MEIRLENLTKVYKGTKADPHGWVAVNNLDILIPDGKLVGLLGPSGCGKSTTLYMISGLLEPTSGRIWFGDEDVTDLTPEKRGIGLVFQNYALYPHMTVYKNIEFPLTNLKVEVPLVTFYRFDLTFKYTLSANDLVDGILKSLQTLLKKMGLNKKQFAVTNTVEGDVLTVNIALINVAASVKEMLLENSNC